MQTIFMKDVDLSLWLLFLMCLKTLFQKRKNKGLNLINVFVCAVPMVAAVGQRKVH